MSAELPRGRRQLHRRKLRRVQRRPDPQRHRVRLLRLIGGILALFSRPLDVRSLSDVQLGELVRVRGRIVPRDLIESPLTGARCVYYLDSEEEFRQAVQGLGGDGFWNVVRRDEAIAEFYLQDDDGTRVIVSPQRADVDRADGPKLRSVDYDIVNRRARQLLLQAGDTIEVIGEVAQADDLFDDGRNYREPATRLMLRAPDDKKLRIRLLDNTE